MIDLNELSKRCKSINDKRMENGATVSKDLLKHCSGELVEAIEARELWLSNKYLSNYTYVDCLEYDKKQFADELADVIVCILIESATHGIDIESALLKCVDKNRKRSLCIGDKK